MEDKKEIKNIQLDDKTSIDLFSDSIKTLLDDGFEIKILDTFNVGQIGKSKEGQKVYAVSNLLDKNDIVYEIKTIAILRKDGVEKKPTFFENLKRILNL